MDRFPSGRKAGFSGRLERIEWRADNGQLRSRQLVAADQLDAL
jgi:hypothetical protein